MNAKRRMGGQWPETIVGWYDFTGARCVERPDLPWTTDPEVASAEGTREMLALCLSCPVRDKCEDVLLVDDATAGFWAGQWAEVMHDLTYHTQAPAVRVATAAMNTWIG